MTAGRSSTAFHAALPVLAVLVAYHEVPRFPFLQGWDDDEQVFANPNLDPVTPGHLARLWTEPYQHLYVPVTYTAYAALATVARRTPPTADAAPETRFDPRVFHTANLALHAACVLVAFALLRRLCGGALAAGVGALFFGLHPLQVESVAWVAELKGVLAGFLGLVALWRYVASVQAGGGGPRGAPAAAHPARAQGLAPALASVQAGGGGPRGAPAAAHPARAYRMALAAAVLAMLAKPTAVALPVVAALLDRFALGSALRDVVRRLWPWLLAAAVVVALTSWAQLVSSSLDTIPLSQRALVASDALGFYLRKFVVPWPLCTDYGRTPEAFLGAGGAAWALLVPVGLAGAVLALRRRAPWLRESAGVFVAALLPVSGLVAFNYQVYSTVADRYAYLALLGPALAVAHLVAGLPPRAARAGAAASFLVVGLALGVPAFAQARTWKDTSALFEHVLAVNPRSWGAHNNLGAVRLRQQRQGEALAHFMAALKLRPHYELAWSNAGMLLEMKGRHDDAISAFNQALAIRPDYPEAHNNLATALAHAGRLDEATAHWREALRLQPGLVQARDNLRRAAAASGAGSGPESARPAASFAATGSVSGAASVPGASAAAPGPFGMGTLGARSAATPAFDRGRALEGQGDLAGAAAAYREALAADARFVPARNNLGVLLGRAGRFDEAASELQRALATDPEDGEVHNNLGIVLSQKNQLGEATTHFERAAALRPGHADIELNLGMALHMAGNTAQALPHLEEAVRLQPALRETLRARGLGDAVP